MQHVNALTLTPGVMAKQRHEGLGTLQRAMLSVTKEAITLSRSNHWEKLTSQHASSCNLHTSVASAL